MDIRVLPLFLGDLPLDEGKIDQLLRQNGDLSEPAVLRYNCHTGLKLLADINPSQVGVVMQTGDDLRLPMTIEVFVDLSYRLPGQPFLIISGKGSTNPDVIAMGFTNAVGLRERAIGEFDFPPEFVIAETEAMNTAQSGQLVLPILQERGITVVILVSSFYHLLRNWLTLRKQFDLHGGKDVTILTAVTPPWWYGRRLLSKEMQDTCSGELRRICEYAAKGDCYASIKEALAIPRP